MKTLLIKRLNKKTISVAAAVIAGSMALMSGCGASDQPETGSVTDSVIKEEIAGEEPQAETEDVSTVQAKTETEAVAETETKTEAVAESETENEAAAESETETRTAVEPKTESDAAGKTEPQKEEKADAEPESQAQEQTPAVQQEAPAAEGSVAAGDFAVIVKGVTIPLKGDMSAYTPQLGDPDEFGSAKSCIEAGDDKVYTYGGTVIYTYITNGVDVISLIEITGGESLPSGIHIGSTKAEVIAAYGNSYMEEGTELLYELGDKTIGLQMSGDTVSFIELF